MNAEDRAAFLRALAEADTLIEHYTGEAHADDRAADTSTAPLVGQLGNVAKALLLLTNFLLESRPPAPGPQPLAPPPLAQCMLCPRPATRLAGDWEVCDTCYEGITAPDPAGDDTWAELLADVIGGV